VVAAVVGVAADVVARGEDGGIRRERDDGNAWTAAMPPVE